MRRRTPRVPRLPELLAARQLQGVPREVARRARRIPSDRASAPMQPPKGRKPRSCSTAARNSDPILTKKQFADLVDEVIQQFTMRPGVKVKIAIEIEATSEAGFDDGLQRAVTENGDVLKFRNAKLEPGE